LVSITAAGIALAAAVTTAAATNFPARPIPAAGTTPHAGARDRAADAARLAARLNAERVAARLPALAIDDRLCEIARAHALEMATRGYFGHASLDGASPFDRMSRANYRFGYAGENLVIDRDPDDADRALWQSSEHRDNTLQPHYARIGVGAVSTPGGEYFVADFSD